ncbi:hypothetical protein EP47_11185 [Legionella norrlandica]|uniref:Uncharacterized protein n=1 Tax=Legionella norrlandica TaxID=1498499 RepID=A0A0A2STQ5_9GAMM|nr:hypothetical protein [Legionella norrlandica]KGP62804.1 hypothetical protein EP47_11185 [Legionella norrlandica]
MSCFNKVFIVGAAIALLSSTAFSASCPSIGGYRLSSHNQDNTRCTYTSNGKGTISIQGQRVIHNCPGFIVTDPNYRRVGSCQMVLRAINPIQNGGQQGGVCQCTIAAQ